MEQRGPANEEFFDKERKGKLRMQTISLQELKRRIYHKAKSEKQWRFWGMYVHICRTDTLMEAYLVAKRNDGAPGEDGQTFEDIVLQPTFF